MIRYVTLLSLVIFTLQGCTINEPALPDWDTKWSIHLRPETVSMTEAIDDTVITSLYNEDIGADEIWISVSDTTEPETISREDRAFKAEDQTISNTIGSVRIDPDSVTTINTTVENLLGDLPDVGETIPRIDPQTIAAEPQVVEFNSFRSIVIDSAVMHIRFFNSLFMDIEAGMKIIAFDELTQTVIDTFLFTEPVPSGQFAQSEPVNLIGKMISNRMELRSRIPIAGTSGPVTISQEILDGYYYLKVYMSDVKVSEAEAKIPEQTFTESDSIEVDANGNRLKYAIMDEGNVYLTLGNYMEFSTDAEIKLLNLVDDTGNPYTINTRLMKNSETDLVLDDLKGYWLQHHEMPGQEVTHLFYQVTSRTIPTQDYVRVRSDDSVTVHFTMDSAYVSYFEGEMEETEVKIEPIEENDLFDISAVEGTFTVNDLVLTLNLHNEINFAIDVNLKIAGYHFDESMGRITDSVIIQIDETVERGMTGTPVATSIILDKNSTTPSIVDLMAILPTDLKLTGRASVAGEGSASAGDRIWADYAIESPLRIEFDEPLFYKGDIDSIDQEDLDEDERDDIDKHFTRIFAKMALRNGLPLGTTVKLFLATDSTMLFNDIIEDSTQKIVISNEVEAGVTGSFGFVQEPTVQDVSVELTNEQISIIRNNKLFYATQVEIHPTSGPVSFRKHDEVRIEPVLNIEVRMNPEDE